MLADEGDEGEVEITAPASDVRRYVYECAAALIKETKFTRFNGAAIREDDPRTSRLYAEIQRVRMAVAQELAAKVGADLKTLLWEYDSE